MLIAQITDLHILAADQVYKAPVAGPAPDGERVRADIDTAAWLARAVATLNALVPRPEIAIVTGDLVDHGEPAEYENLRRLLAPLSMPVFLIAGNHDTRDGIRAHFGGDGYLPATGFLQYAIEDFAVRIVALDTLVEGSHHGELCAERLDWLDRTLAARPEKPTLVMMHHPPFATGITYMDEHGFRSADALAAVIARHPQIERIACGHLHRSIDRRFAGTAPSTAHQVRLDLRPGVRLHFRLEPPGYQLHLWDGGGLVTHTAVIGDFPDPYPLPSA